MNLHFRRWNAPRHWTWLLMGCLGLPLHASESAQPWWLPAADSVQHTLSQQASVRAAQAGIPLAQARQQRLEAGPHEWNSTLGWVRRNEQPEQRFNDLEIGFQTGVRWPGKREADRRIGTAELLAGQLRVADTWHEAARHLLTVWFDALREQRQAALLEEQLRLVTQQQAIAERKVQTGEAARLEVLAIAAETARLRAAASTSRTQAVLKQQALLRQYPGLPELPAITAAQLPALPLSDPGSDSAAEWVNSILADNHEIELAEAEAEKARSLAERAQLERRGDPTVGVRANRERGGQDRLLGAFVSFPLGKAGRQADAQAALAEQEVAQQKLAQVKQRVTQEAWRVATELQQYRTSQLQLQQAWEQTRQSAQLQARAYALGESAMTDLLLALRASLDAQLAADLAALDALQAHARLQLDSHRLWPAPGHEAN